MRENRGTDGVMIQEWDCCSECGCYECRKNAERWHSGTCRDCMHCDHGNHAMFGMKSEPHNGCEGE